MWTRIDWQVRVTGCDSWVHHHQGSPHSPRELPAQDKISPVDKPACAVNNPGTVSRVEIFLSESILRIHTWIDGS